METRIWLFMIISCLAVFFPIHGENQNQQERTEKKVLILHSYHYSNAWSDSITEGILSTLKTSLQLDIEIEAEFLDFIRFDKPEYSEEDDSYRILQDDSHKELLQVLSNLGNADILHQPQGIFYKYKAEIIALVSFIAILFVLLLSLLWMNFKLRVLKRALQKERDLLDQKVEERTESIKAMQKKVILRERQAAVGSMLAGMAHEMNTPIGVAITALSHVISKKNEKGALILRGEFTSAEAAQFIQECGESVDMAFDCLSRTAKLIDEFKTLAPQGSLSDLADFDIFSFLTDIKKAYSKQLQAQGISVSVQGTHIVLTSYPGLIYRIMTTLILNSIEHGFPPGWINTKQIEMTCDRLDWSGTDAPVVIRYRDNGRGIPSDISERIFEPFTTTDRNKGKIGLGLHKVYKLVTEELMGTIEYSDRPKGGTQFTIYLPASDFPEQSL